MRRLVLLLSLGWLLPLAAQEVPATPWPNGERLKYEITWGALDAADGEFLAADKGDHWEFTLDLKTKGMVETLYPIRDHFYSYQSKTPWRSTEYGEDRTEPNRTIVESTKVTYGAGFGYGVRDRKSKNKTDIFAFLQPALDDIGSMLYSMRRGDWKVGDKRVLTVYESGKVKFGEAVCEAKETKAIGNYPAQPVIRLHAMPTDEQEKKKGQLTIWLTDDARRLPLRADLIFKYGTFTVDLAELPSATPAPAAPPPSIKPK